MKAKEEAQRLYNMVRGEIKHGHDPQLLHATTKAVCGEMINTIMRAAEDQSFWYDVKMDLGEIEDPEQ